MRACVSPRAGGHLPGSLAYVPKPVPDLLLRDAARHREVPPLLECRERMLRVVARAALSTVPSQ